MTSFAGPQWKVSLPPAATASVIVRTPTIYRDIGDRIRSLCRVSLSYQVKDIDGRMPVRTDGISAQLRLQLLASDRKSVVGNWGPALCDPPGAKSFAGSCTVIACDDTIRSWFSSTRDVTVQATVDILDAELHRNFSSPSAQLVLSQIPPVPRVW